jgi:hypothetical protein
VRKRWLVLVVSVCAAVSVLVGTALSSGYRGVSTPTPSAGPAGVARARGGSPCPRRLLPLTANPISPSVTAALVSDLLENKPQVRGAEVASDDTQRGPQVKALCGARVWRRTVVVYITDRALLPSQSAAQRVLLVGRTAGGYRVWQRAH